MAKQNVPKWKKITPSTGGEEVLKSWQARYSELHDMDYSKWGALFRMGKEYDLHPNTIEVHLFPRVKEKRKKYDQKYWAKKRADVENRKSPGYKRRYQNLRNHIDDAIRDAMADAEQPMTMDEISARIQKRDSIAMAPSTICGLIAKYESKHGKKLLNEMPTQPPTYVLAPKSDEGLIK